MQTVKSKRIKKPTVQLHPNQIERTYRKELDSYVAIITQEIKSVLLPKISSLVNEVALSRGIRLDSFSDDIDAIFKAIDLRIGARLPESQKSNLINSIAASTSQFNKLQMIRQFERSLGVNVFSYGDKWLVDESKLFVKNNVALITSLKDDYLRKLELNVTQAVQNGISSRSLASQIYSEVNSAIGDQDKVTKSRAELIARDQIAKFNGNLTELRQRDVGVDSYTWITAGDERVRDSHRTLDGKVFKWSSPPSVGHPGQDYNCRCIAEPIFKGSTQTEALDALLNQRE